MTVGADRKKIGILIGLGLVALYVFYTNVLSNDDAPAGVTRVEASRPTTTSAPSALDQPQATEPARRSGTRGAGQEFKPKFRVGKPGEGPDPASTDPTLRLDLLAKIQSVKIEGGERNLFQFGPAPLPKTPEPKIVPTKPEPEASASNAKTNEPPPKPPATPIPLKFYGYTSQSAGRRALFLDGEDIYIAGEGDLVKRRYKVVKIGINSVVMQDVQEKHEQTLPLEPQPS